MPRIYLPTLTPLLPLKQAQHVRVLRLRVGEELELFDGKGHFALARLSHIDKKSIAVEILSIREASAPKTFPVHLAQSLIRNEQMDWAIQKAVELGVTTITPIIAERCQGRLSQEQALKKYEHWYDVMIAACEQSGLNFLPVLQPPISLQDFLTSSQKGTKLVLDPYAACSLSSVGPTAEQATLLIGPEGGFTAAEVELAKQAGYQNITLHEQILRAETAAITAISVVQFYFQQK